MKSCINTFSAFIKFSTALSYMLVSAEKKNDFKLKRDIFFETMALH